MLKEHARSYVNNVYSGWRMWWGEVVMKDLGRLRIALSLGGDTALPSSPTSSHDIASAAALLVCLPTYFLLSAVVQITNETKWCYYVVFTKSHLLCFLFILCDPPKGMRN